MAAKTGIELVDSDHEVKDFASSVLPLDMFVPSGGGLKPLTKKALEGLAPSQSKLPKPIADAIELEQQAALAGTSVVVGNTIRDFYENDTPPGYVDVFLPINTSVSAELGVDIPEGAEKLKDGDGMWITYPGTKLLNNRVHKPAVHPTMCEGVKITVYEWQEIENAVAEQLINAVMEQKVLSLIPGELGTSIAAPELEVKAKLEKAAEAASKEGKAEGKLGKRVEQVAELRSVKVTHAKGQTYEIPKITVPKKRELVRVEKNCPEMKNRLKMVPERSAEQKSTLRLKDGMLFEISYMCVVEIKNIARVMKNVDKQSTPMATCFSLMVTLMKSGSLEEKEECRGYEVFGKLTYTQIQTMFNEALKKDSEHFGINFTIIVTGRQLVTAANADPAANGDLIAALSAFGVEVENGEIKSAHGSDVPLVAREGKRDPNQTKLALEKFVTIAEKKKRVDELLKFNAEREDKKQKLLLEDQKALDELENKQRQARAKAHREKLEEDEKQRVKEEAEAAADAKAKREEKEAEEKARKDKEKAKTKAEREKKEQKEKDEAKEAELQARKDEEEEKAKAKKIREKKEAEAKAKKDREAAEEKEKEEQEAETRKINDAIAAEEKKRAKDKKAEELKALEKKRQFEQAQFEANEKVRKAKEAEAEADAEKERKRQQKEAEEKEADRLAAKKAEEEAQEKKRLRAKQEAKERKDAEEAKAKEDEAALEKKTRLEKEEAKARADKEKQAREEAEAAKDEERRREKNRAALIEAERLKKITEEKEAYEETQKRLKEEIKAKEDAAKAEKEKKKADAEAEKKAQEQKALETKAREEAKKAKDAAEAKFKAEQAAEMDKILLENEKKAAEAAREAKRHEQKMKETAEAAQRAAALRERELKEKQAEAEHQMALIAEASRIEKKKIAAKVEEDAERLKFVQTVLTTVTNPAAQELLILNHLYGGDVRKLHALQLEKIRAAQPPKGLEEFEDDQGVERAEEKSGVQFRAQSQTAPLPDRERHGHRNTGGLALSGGPQTAKFSNPLDRA